MKTPLHLLKGNFFLYMCACLTFLLSGCSQYQNSTDNEEGFFLLSGQVLDAVSGSPIKGAKVTGYADESSAMTERKTVDVTTTTDSKGRFSMRVPSYPLDMYDYPSYSFSVKHPNYADAWDGFNYSTGVKIYATRIK